MHPWRTIISWGSVIENQQEIKSETTGYSRMDTTRAGQSTNSRVVGELDLDDDVDFIKDFSFLLGSALSRKQRRAGK
jgi:hypothetical protein